MVVNLFSLLLGRATDVLVGLILVTNGIIHMLMPASSLAAVVGLPSIVAMILGIPVFLLGLLYLVRGLMPGAVR